MRFLFVLFLLFSTQLQAQSYVDEYLPATYENFSNLMWRYDVHDLNNEDIFKAYFQSVNCPLFSKYYSNDFVWKTIVEGFKRDIRYFSKNTPNKFFIQASLPIERYDFDKSAFIINDEYALDNAGSIQIPFYEKTPVNCIEPIEKRHFPKSIKFIADRKFALEEIPMGMDDANALLDKIKNYQYEDIDGNRVVAVRFLITINGLQDYDDDMKLPGAKYKGSLDEIAFFEDPQMTKLIWKKQFKLFQDQPAAP